MPFRVGVGVLAVALVVAVLVVVAGGGDEPRPHGPAPTVTATPSPTPSPVPLDAPTGGPSLALGITEPNANLITTGTVPPDWRRWRDALARIHPAVYRIVVPWAASQPDPAQPPALDVPSSGCMRDKPPCAGFANLRGQLQALASRGWQGMVVITGMPAWA
ncbi:MAG TPA: hypothetical protein VFM58_14820, partial [Solirubrobacteraceae bacterium]|nr:hypothetical protein [Solirubrobacteraceae bacterium]